MRSRRCVSLLLCLILLCSRALASAGAEHVGNAGELAELVRRHAEAGDRAYTFTCGDSFGFMSHRDQIADTLFRWGARSYLWHYDRSSGQVTLSEIVYGEDLRVPEETGGARGDTASANETQRTGNDAADPAGETQGTVHDAADPAGETQGTVHDAADPAGETQGTVHDAADPAGETQGTVHDAADPAGEAQGTVHDAADPAGEAQRTVHDAADPAGASATRTTGGVCTSAEEVRAVLADAAATRASFIKIKMDNETFDAYSADEFRLLQEDGAACGISPQYTIQYGGFLGSNNVEITDPVYCDRYTRCSTPEEAGNAMRQFAESLTDSFILVCGQTAYDTLRADENRLLEEYCSNAGILLPNMISFGGLPVIVFDNVIYYPGYRTARLYAAGRTDLMSEEERQLLNTALDITGGAPSSGDPLATEKYLHDALCAGNTYFLHDSDGYSPYDTAIGALLYGRSDCDGYADAFYLLCSLSGLPVRMMSGNVKPEYLTDSGIGSEHMWNLVSPDGTGWYAVDVTWDDNEDGEPLHIWFNFARDRGEQTYSWDERALQVSWSAREEDAYSYYNGRLGGYTFTDADAAAAALASGAYGNSLEIRLPGTVSTDQLLNAIKPYAQDLYGYKAYQTNAGYTFATICFE